jgi:pimeloyl-ACP methyl ester carboxylesterase
MPTFTNHRTDHDGRTLAWRGCGPDDGPVVVLLHGFPDGPATWDGYAAHLSEQGCRVVAPALRGFVPGTAVPGEPSTPVTAAEDVVRLLDALAVSSAVVVGHDWGAAATYALAGIAPDRVDRVVPIAIPHPRAVRPGPGMLWGVRHFAWLGLPGGSMRLALRDVGYLDRLAQRWAPNWTDGGRDDLVAAARHRLRDSEVRRGAVRFYRDLLRVPDRRASRRTPVPGLLVVGSDDLAAYGSGSFMHTPDAFTDTCDVVVIDGTGHWPHLERPEAFVDATVRFVLDGPAAP